MRGDGRDYIHRRAERGRPVRVTSMDTPRTLYADAGDVGIAYQVLGEGPSRRRVRAWLGLQHRGDVGGPVVRSDATTHCVVHEADRVSDKRGTRFVGSGVASRPSEHRDSHGQWARGHGCGQIGFRQLCSATRRAAACRSCSPGRTRIGRTGWCSSAAMRRGPGRLTTRGRRILLTERPNRDCARRRRATRTTSRNGSRPAGCPTRRSSIGRRAICDCR